jgi:hypothetical protein
MRKSVKLQSPEKALSEAQNLKRNAELVQDIFAELEIPQRTQLPPSADLVTRLNEIASKPPFSYIHKAKEYETR